MKFRKTVLILLLTWTATCVWAQADSARHWGASVSVNPGNLLKTKQYEGKYDIGSKKNISVVGEVSYATLPCDSDAFAADYNYPVFSAGVRYSVNNRISFHRIPDYDWENNTGVDYDSRAGNSLALYGKFNRAFFRSRHILIDGSLQMGAAYCHTLYDKNDNVDNDLIGSHINIYFGTGVYLTYMLMPEWGLRAGMEYWHLSNGALNRPNKGANFVGPVLGVSYMPYYKEVLRGRKSALNTSFDKYWFLNFTAGLGAKTLEEDWNESQWELSPEHPDFRTENFHLYMAYSAQADIMYRYARRWATGVGFDVNYGSYASRIEERDQQKHFTDKHSPWSAGISVKHQTYFHQISANVSLGYYFYREMGHRAKKVEKRYYETVGLQYHFPTLAGLALGFRVKAHLFKADYTELMLSCPIYLKKGAGNGR